MNKTLHFLKSGLLKTRFYRNGFLFKILEILYFSLIFLNLVDYFLSRLLLKVRNGHLIGQLRKFSRFFQRKSRKFLLFKPILRKITHLTEKLVFLVIFINNLTRVFFFDVFLMTRKFDFFRCFHLNFILKNFIFNG